MVYEKQNLEGRREGRFILLRRMIVPLTTGAGDAEARATLQRLGEHINRNVYQHSFDHHKQDCPILTTDASSVNGSANTQTLQFDSKHNNNSIIRARNGEVLCGCLLNSVIYVSLLIVLTNRHITNFAGDIDCSA